jgi:hypothetical protein
MPEKRQKRITRKRNQKRQPPVKIPLPFEQAVRGLTAVKPEEKDGATTTK